MAVGKPSHMVPSDMQRASIHAEMSRRHCSRTGCCERAEVTLTYDYAHSHVWLDELLTERDPHAYDLCARHASRLSVPHGWRLDDRRMTVRHELIAV